MKINVNKHLGFVLMLLALCSLFLASGCEPDPWESWRAKDIDSEYIGFYEVTEVYGSDGKLVAHDGTWDGDVEVDKNHFYSPSPGEKVHIDNFWYGNLNINEMHERLDTLERCKQVPYSDGTFNDDEACGEFKPPRYRERGLWGNYKIYFEFYGANKYDPTMDMAFTDSKDPSRNFRLVCKKKS